MDEQGARKGRRAKDSAGEAVARPRIRSAPDPRLSRSVEYGFAMLECFSARTPALGIAELARAIGISRSTTHRYATTLVMLGCLEQDHKRKYRLSSRALAPGRTAIDTIRLQVPARAVLEDLRDWTGHTVGMGTLEGGRALYLYRLHAHGRGQYEADLGLGAGASVPLHCSALGKILMAALPEHQRASLLARGGHKLASGGPKAITGKRRLAAELQQTAARGLALSDEELARGSRSIARMVDIAGGRAVAIDVTAPSSAGSASELWETVGPLLVRAAQRISAAAHAAQESASS